MQKHSDRRSLGTTAVRRCGWPFHWIADVTTFDPATRIHQYVATIHQSGARSLTEAAANARAMGEASALAKAIEAVAAVLDMSDPDHKSFADSAADCLDALLAHEQEIRRILTALADPPAAADHIRAACTCRDAVRMFSPRRA